MFYFKQNMVVIQWLCPHFYNYHCDRPQDLYKMIMYEKC